MSKQTLKDILRPPFSVKNGLIIDAENALFVFTHDEYKEFLVAALNEKWERDFHTEEPLDKRHPHIHCPQCQYPIYKSDFDTDEDGEPLRWIKSRSLGIDWIDCPVCKHGLQEGTKDLNYCPFCGQKLDPPEEA